VGSEWGPLVLADDLAHRPVLSVMPDDNLHTALRRMTELNTDEIPVVDPADHSHLLGLLSRRDLNLAYSSLIESLRANGTTTAKPSQSGETVQSH
jgi:CIC family chloride channel protein